MNVKLPREQAVIQAAIAVLKQHMEPSKLVVLLAALQRDDEDYVGQRATLFAGETVASLVEKMKQYQPH
jgi:hypothetical protein